MSKFRCVVLLSAASVIALCSGFSHAGPMPIARRTGGILASDLSLDKVYLCRDLNGNGNSMDPGEVTVFLDATNASGIPAPTGAIFSMFQSDDGTVYLVDGDTDAVYACRDNNGDGDALDAGEARVFFNGFNASLLTLPTPGGICQGADGAIYVTNAGIPASPLDGLFRLIDLNNDGDALDAGEQSVFVDETALLVTGANPFECSLVGDKVYFLDPRGGSTDVILVADDADHDGTVSATELGTFFVGGGAVVPAPTDFTCQSDGTSVYVHQSTGSGVQTVWRLTDLDHSGVIDQVNEGVEIWSENSLPSGTTMSNSFSITLGPGMIAISSNGTDLNDEIIIAKDLNNDGDYNDAGGTSVFVQGTAAVSFPENIRALLFYGGPCKADINNSWSVTVQDIFDFLGFYFTNDLRADVNASGSVTVQDIFDFLGYYFSGC